MKSRMFIAPVAFLFALLFGASSLMAQSTEEQMKAVEQQMKMAERQMEHAKYKMKFDFQQSENRSSLVLSKSYDSPS